MPILHAGDVFDRWAVPTEFVNLMIEHLPRGIYAVPGQHDLPNHNYADIGRSAYWNLVEAGTLIDLTPGAPQVVGNSSAGLVEVYGYPWGYPPEPLPNRALVGGGARPVVALVHRYLWYGEAKYKGAPDDGFVGVRQKDFAGYKAVVSGDNHHPFTCNVRDGNGFVTVFNHGTALRRHADERELRVGPGVLYDDGSVERVGLALPPEVWADAPAAALAAPLGVDADRLLALLRAGGEAAVSFRDAVAHARREAAPPLTAAENAVLDSWLHAAGVS